MQAASWRQSWLVLLTATTRIGPRNTRALKASTTSARGTRGRAGRPGSPDPLNMCASSGKWRKFREVAQEDLKAETTSGAWRYPYLRPYFEKLEKETDEKAAMTIESGPLRKRLVPVAKKVSVPPKAAGAAPPLEAGVDGPSDSDGSQVDGHSFTASEELALKRLMEKKGKAGLSAGV